MDILIGGICEIYEIPNSTTRTCIVLLEIFLFHLILWNVTHLYYDLILICSYWIDEEKTKEKIKWYLKKSSGFCFPLWMLELFAPGIVIILKSNYINTYFNVLNFAGCLFFIGGKCVIIISNYLEN